MTAEKFDVYTHVTNQIIAQIEAGTPPWRKPWTGSGACYRGERRTALCQSVRGRGESRL